MSPVAADVIAFVADHARVPMGRVAPDTTLFGDLKLDGDDGVELLDDFAQRFGVDMNGCRYADHFGPEGCVLWAPLVWLLHAARSGSAEERAGLQPIRVADLIEAAESRAWPPRRGT